MTYEAPAGMMIHYAAEFAIQEAINRDEAITETTKRKPLSLGGG